LQALRRESLVPPGRPERRIQLCYVDDIVETLVRAMESERRVPTVCAPSSELTVLELASEVAAAAGLESVATNAAVGDDAPSARWVTGPSLADALPAAMVFGMGAPVGLADGLARTWRWFEARTGRRLADRLSGVYSCDKPVAGANPPPLARVDVRAG
jgi:UDP-glucuronate decarboxylase